MKFCILKFIYPRLCNACNSRISLFSAGFLSKDRVVFHLLNSSILIIGLGLKLFWNVQFIGLIISRVYKERRCLSDNK